jgi:protein-disulfide isomerase
MPVVPRALKGLAIAGLLVTACSTAAQPPQRLGPNDVVATVGGSPLTLAEVDARALQEPASSFGSARLVQALYAARRAAIDEIVANRLMDAEAKARGIDRATLVEREIAAKAPTPTEADITAWYQANPARVQGATLDQVRAPIKQLLIQERMDTARAALIATLKDRTKVTVALEPPRVEVADGGRPVRGSKTAPVEVIEFSDFQCPFCQRANPTVEQVVRTYGDRIKFVYRHYPLPNHPNARPAAEAAACAEAQGKFWEYHDRLFANPTKLSDADLKQHAVAIGLDASQFNTCVDTHQTKAGVDTDIKAADAAGVSGTPAFFINGRSVEGAQPFEVLKSVIDEELARK